MRGRPTSIKEEDLLDAARDVFLEEGHAATTAKIAERAGVSEGILFYRYKSKEALLAALIHREIQPPESMRNMIKTASQRSIEENLKHILEILMDALLLAYPFFELAQGSPNSKELCRLAIAKERKRPSQQMLGLISRYFKTEMSLGRIRNVNAIPVSRAILGGCIDYLRSRHVTGNKMKKEAFVQSLVDVLIYGVAKPEQPKRRR
jgi:AcrR family transcriptional regulator